MAAFGRLREQGWGARADVDESLAELWRRALSAGLHGSGCACSVGGFVLTANDLEMDILDFLSGRYSRATAPALADVLATRETDHASTFPAWLQTARARLGDDDWLRLDADVRTVLTSIGGTGGPFVCA